MPRPTTALTRLVATLVALAIGLVVGARPVAVLAAAQVAPAALVGDGDTYAGSRCAAGGTVDDALKVGHRLEPRVAAAPQTGRTRALPPPGWAAPIGWITAAAGQPGAASESSRGRASGWNPLPLVKHVPRMESGDPPRV